KLESKIVELEFQVVHYEREISHLKATYKNLFDSIKSNRAYAKLHDLIFKNAKLRARLFKNTSESVKNISGLVHTARTRRPQPKGNIRNARILSASKSSEVKKNVTVEEHLVTQGIAKLEVSKGGLNKLNGTELLFNLSWFTSNTGTAAVSDGGHRSKFFWDETDLVRLATGPDQVRLATGPDLNMETELEYHETGPDLNTYRSSGIVGTDLNTYQS
nr:hypothetical protein [Tanacetum cinerariifolium]